MCNLRNTILSLINADHTYSAVGWLRCRWSCRSCRSIIAGRRVTEGRRVRAVGRRVSACAAQKPPQRRNRQSQPGRTHADSLTLPVVWSSELCFCFGLPRSLCRIAPAWWTVFALLVHERFHTRLADPWFLLGGSRMAHCRRKESEYCLARSPHPPRHAELPQPPVLLDKQR